MPYNLLIVDDQPNDLRYQLTHLRGAGMNCGLCRNGREAVIAFNREHFDLILLDVMMGSGDSSSLGNDEDDAKDYEDDTRFGLEVYDHIRAHSSWRVPIIILTAFAGEDWLERWFDEKRKADPRLLILDKATVPPTLHRIILDRIASGPYYARDVRSDTAIEVHYQCVSEDDADALNTSWSEDDSKFRDVFIHYAMDANMSAHTYAIRKAAGHDDRVHGIVFTAGNRDDTEWVPQVLFESAPWNKYDADDRELRRIGRICVARIIRESQARGQFGEFSINVGSAAMFFESIGFIKLPQRERVYVLDHDAAISILESVTR